MKPQNKAEPPSVSLSRPQSGPQSGLNFDTLLHIFRHLDLKDAFTCRLVSRAWNQAIRQHFRSLPKLKLKYQDISTLTAEDDLLGPRVSPRHHPYRLKVYHIVGYTKFANLLSLFPSVRTFTLRNHPVNDIYLSLLVLFLPRLQGLHLKSCWIHPTMLAERLLAQSATCTHPLWAILGRFYCPKYLKENVESSLELLLDTLRQMEHPQALSPQLGAFLEVLSGQCKGTLQAGAGQVSGVAALTQTQLTPAGYSLLVGSYQKLTRLSLVNCGLNEETASLVFRELREVKEINISDNENIEGTCLQYIAGTCVSLTAGSFNVHVSILDLLTGLVRSPTAARSLRSLELTGCVATSLHPIERLPQLTSLILHFYTNRVSPNQDAFTSLTTLTQLRTLVLQQEYCYEEPSAVEGTLFCALARACRHLERLEILGEYGWRLRLGDESLRCLAESASSLRHLVLTGNSPHITDTGIESLGTLSRLESLSLTSFDSLTDASICGLVDGLPSLSFLCLRDNSQLSMRTLEACIRRARAHPQRALNVHMDEKQMSPSTLLVKYATNLLRDSWPRKMVSCKELASQKEKQPEVASREAKKRWPTNLNVLVDENLRSYKYDADELSMFKLIIIFLASLLIILMMATTLAVVFLLPTGMAIYLLWERIAASLSTR